MKKKISSLFKLYLCSLKRNRSEIKRLIELGVYIEKHIKNDEQKDTITKITQLLSSLENEIE
jgi:hypothetical protein